MKWKRHHCIKCCEKVSWVQKINTGGCCPHCGHLSPGNIMDTVKR